MTLAGLSPAGVLLVRAGEPMVLRFTLARVDGTPQDLTGRTFALAFRRSRTLVPFLVLPGELSGDALSIMLPITAAQATAVYAEGESYALSYDVVELSGNASISKWTQRVSVDQGPEFPSDITPIWIDLPYSSAVVDPAVLVVIEKGAMGAGVEERLHDMGEIAEPTTAAMKEWLLSQGADGAQPFAQAAEAARDIALLQASRSLEQADRATEQQAIATEQAGISLEQANRSEAEALRSELAASASASAGRLYATKEEGEAVTPDGDVFYTQSPNDTEVAIVWRMDGDTAVDTGKRTPSATFIDVAVSTATDAADTATGAASTATNAAANAGAAADDANASKLGAGASATDSALARDGALAAQASAEAAAQAALLSGNIFANKAAGEAATPNGQQFVAYGPADNYATRYLMVAGAGVVQDSYPNRTALDAAVSRVAYEVTAREQLPSLDGMEPVLSSDVIWSVPGETSGPAVTREGDFYARQPHSLGGPVLTDFWPHVELADANGVPLIAIHPEGFVYTLDTVPFLSDTYRYVVVSGDLAVLSSVTVDGGSADPSKSWYAIEREGHILLSTQDGPLVRMTDVAGDLTPPQIIGSELVWTDFSSGAGIVTRLPLGEATGFSASITTIEHILASGQSLSRGIPLTPVTIGAPDPGRLMMFSQGVNASGITLLTSDDFSNLSSASVSVSEVPVLSAGRQYLSDKALSTGVLVSSHGFGGYRFDQLYKGTILYANMITGMQTAARKATLAGLPYHVHFLSWIQGEADTGVAKGVYIGWMAQMQADVTADYQAIVSTTDQVVMVSSQPSNFTAYSRSLVTPMVLEHLEASILWPTKFICTGPKYDLPYNDNTHPTSAGFQHMGDMDGRAMRLFKAGLWKGPLYAKTAVRSVVTVVLTFNAPHGGAAIDFFTGIVSDPGNYGITFHQTGGNAVTVASVAITGAFEITLTLSAEPTGTAQQIGIAATGTPGQWAGPTTGGRSCIRSAIIETDPQGRALDHYACHQLIDIT